MKPHSRIRNAIKWSGLTATLLFAAAWIVSGWWSLEWHTGTLTEAVMQTGCLRGTFEFGPSVSTSTMNGWYFWRLPPDAMMRWTFRYQHSAYASATPGALCHIFYITLPLWIPTLLAAIPTAITWRLDAHARRRARIGLCPKCAYDRTGLASNTPCPECGPSHTNHA